MDARAIEDIEVIIPNLHWRYSGVTATNRLMAPRIARMVSAVWCGRDRPDGIAALGFTGLLRLRLRPPRRQPVRIWHARRNDEMMIGLLLKLLGWRLGLIFTSVAQRHHTWITRFLMRRMDAIIAASRASASYLRLPATTIPHGIDTRVHRPPEDRAAAFAASGLPGRYAIGCFGRVRAQKGTDVFVEAMCRLLPDFPAFSAVIVGAITPEHQPFVAALREKIAAAGLSERIRFLGEVPIDEVPRWYQRVTIYAFTSRNEGFGLTLLEAMAAGTALVAARAGAAEEVVRDGDTGVLVPPGDAEALAEALRPLMADPAQAQAMGARARAQILAEYDADREAERIIEVYRRVWAARA